MWQVGPWAGLMHTRFLCQGHGRSYTLLHGWPPTLLGVLPDFSTFVSKKEQSSLPIQHQILLLNAQMFHRSSSGGGLLLGMFMGGECYVPGAQGVRHSDPSQMVRAGVSETSRLLTPPLSPSPHQGSAIGLEEPSWMQQQKDSKTHSQLS